MFEAKWCSRTEDPFCMSPYSRFHQDFTVLPAQNSCAESTWQWPWFSSPILCATVPADSGPRPRTLSNSAVTLSTLLKLWPPGRPFTPSIRQTMPGLAVVETYSVTRTQELLGTPNLHRRGLSTSPRPFLQLRSVTGSIVSMSALQSWLSLIWTNPCGWAVFLYYN